RTAWRAESPPASKAGTLVWLQAAHGLHLALPIFAYAQMWPHAPNPKAPTAAARRIMWCCPKKHRLVLFRKEINVSQFARSRGVRGAASLCALAAILYLFARNLFQFLASALLRLVVPGASLTHPIGISAVTVELLAMLVSVGALLIPVVFLLRGTRLRFEDLRLTIPAHWSPGFCVVVFFGVANLANLLGGLASHLTGTTQPVNSLPSGGLALFVSFLALCVMPAVFEEILFRGALQGLMRPCGSAVAIFAPALLFALLHSELPQILTAFVCGIFLGWLTERTGSLLPGMLLHFLNNSIAFLSVYLHLFAPNNIALLFELTVIVAFPLAALWMIYHAWKQGFRFSAGLRSGVDVFSVFSSPAYLAAILFLLVMELFL
ncbi:MAG: lysostaphin resistance A-like protein, partial [Gemmiger sp.]